MRGQLIKRYFITGLLIWVPLLITGWVLALIVSTLDQSLRLLPGSIPPKRGQLHWPKTRRLVGKTIGPHPGRHLGVQQRQTGLRYAVFTERQRLS